MPFWPFKRRPKTDKAARMQSNQADLSNNTTTTKALAERSQNLQGSAVPMSQSAQPPSSSSAVHKHRESQCIDPGDMKRNATKSPPATSALDKENLNASHRINTSQEDITALTTTWQLNQSPHLRPADSERAEIPHEFRPDASSTSVHHIQGTSSRPGTLRSKRSTFDAKSVKRKSSSKRREDWFREEEIKAMSAIPPVPNKRPGDGPPRRDSYKRRTFDSTTSAAANREDKESAVSPPDQEEPVAGTVEQNGWEVQHFWINPRPAIRLSSIPAYTLDNSPQTVMPLPRDISQKLKEKEPVRELRRVATIGDDADDLDSNDIRAVLERDAKRREKRDRERQERIDRKMKETSGGRRRASSAKKRRDNEAEKAIEAGTPAVPALPRQQSDIHPALREEAILKDTEMVGLGIGGDNHSEEEDPFKDPIAQHRAETEKKLEEGPIHDTRDAENPFADSVIETAREVRMSTAITPPLSPVDRYRRSSAKLPLEDITTALPVAASAPASATATSPLSPTNRGSRSDSKDRRAGAWASFFKRGNTQKESKQAAEPSFSNTSRDSTNRHSLPPHLVQERVSPFQRTPSGAPTRTMSKFREDLPDAPISPPDSRVQSPDLPVNAAAIAAQQEVIPAGQELGQAARDSAIESGLRSDTSVSPARGHVPMSTSMASVDSEGSWLASGGSVKRTSQQSGLTRSYGSLTRRTPDFNASYEDLGAGGDKDAEYVQRTAQSAEARRSALMERISGSATAGASVEDESVYDDSDKAVNPLTVHESMRRKPTLVHSDPALRSREGLLSEYSAGEDQTASPAALVVAKDESPDEDDDEDDIGTKLEKARSVDYGSGHARKVSAGSAKLLDVAPRRMSASPNTAVSPILPVSSIPHQTEEQLEESSEAIQ